MGSHSFLSVLDAKLLFLQAIFICNISVSFMFAVSNRMDNYDLKMFESDDDEFGLPVNSHSRQNEQLENFKKTVIDGLQFQKIPDITKMNVSQEEYSRMYGIYLQHLEESQINDSSHSATVPKFYTFPQIERHTKHRQRHGVNHIVFNISSIRPKTATVEHSTLRLLASAVPRDGPVRVHIYQLLNNRKQRVRLVDTRQVHLTSGAPKWCDFDVTSAVRAWIEHNEPNKGLEIHCAECSRHGHQTFIDSSSASAHLPVINALISFGAATANLNKRSAERALFFEENRRTDCHNKNRKRCCRHKMQFNVKELGLDDVIIQPKEFDGGICKGRCPPHFNAAHNHAIIQSIMWKQNKDLTPRVCCAPSKLRSLEVLTVDEHDSTKLMLRKWDNMVVQECACS